MTLDQMVWTLAQFVDHDLGGDPLQVLVTVKAVEEIDLSLRELNAFTRFLGLAASQIDRKIHFSIYSDTPVTWAMSNSFKLLAHGDARFSVTLSRTFAEAMGAVGLSAADLAHNVWLSAS